MIRPMCTALLVCALAIPAPQASLAFANSRMREDSAGQAEKKMAAPMPSFAEPSLAPDRAEVAFVSGGDIWTAPLAGGEATLLIAHPATESRPLYSPDGKRLAFISNRTGAGDIYVYTFATAETRRITFDDAPDQLDAWSRDGKWLYFSSGSRDISGRSDIWRVSPEGGTPMQVSADRYATEYFSAPSPDGGSVAFTARGIVQGQWWRKGHSHIDESEIWLLRDATPPKYERVSGGGAKELWPMWSADGKTVYFVRDKGGVQNIMKKAVGAAGDATPLTKFTAGRVLWPSISYDGKTIVFERDFGIWRADTSSGAAKEVNISLRSAPPAGATEHRTLTGQFEELALSPDGKKVAFIGRGEVFAASAKDGGPAARVTRTVAAESQVAWSPDSKSLVYASERSGKSFLYLYDFASEAERQLTSGGQEDSTPVFSPDGKWIAFFRDGKRLCLTDTKAFGADGKDNYCVASGTLDRPPFNSERPLVWSPDGKWLAYFDTTGKNFSNVYVVASARPAAGAKEGPGQPVSFLPHAFANTISWSSDGTFLIFDSGQRTENRMVARVDLTPRIPKFREDTFRDLFTEKKPAAKGGEGKSGEAKAGEPEKKPVEIVFDDIRRRLRVLNVGVDLFAQALSPDGKTLLLTSSVANQTNLYTYPLDELATEPPVARQITSTAEPKQEAQFSPDGKEVWFLGGGRIQSVNLDNRQVRSLSVTAEMDTDFEEVKMEAFKQAWRLQRDNFYDPKFHGVDWNAVYEQYEPRMRAARTTDEFRRLLNLMVGELNASHSGAAGPGAPAAAPTGRLGVRFDRGEYERSGKLKISEVIPLTPAAIAGIKVGETIVAVEKTALDARSNFDEAMNNTVGKRITLSIADATGAKRDVVVQPVGRFAEINQMYRAWVDSRRAYVEKASGGRLGYVHMPDMGFLSLQQLYADLDTANHQKEGVVIDIRDNNGGFVNAYALDVFARRPYLFMEPRGQMRAPARTMLGQRALEAPTILVINQQTLSDGEDFTEGYRALKLGKVVGEPTAGWIIYTSGATLLDGTTLRMPFIRVTDSSGKDMELNPRPVDVPVQRPIGEWYTGKDSQLDAAVAELLKQLPAKR